MILFCKTLLNENPKECSSQVFVFASTGQMKEPTYLANYIAFSAKGASGRVKNKDVLGIGYNPSYDYCLICLIGTWPALGSIHGAALAGPWVHLHVHLIILI